MCLKNYGWRCVISYRRQLKKKIPKRKKSKKAKWLSEEASQIAKERREVKSKGEKERYSQINAYFQKTAQRDKKAFFNEQCVKLEGHSRRGKPRGRKIGNIKGAFFPKMDTIKDINGRDLLDAEEIKKRGKEDMEELYKKDPNELDYYDAVVSHPELDIWRVKSSVP